MKKLIFTLSSVISLSVFAQAPLKNDTKKFNVSGDISAPKKAANYGKADVSNWYEPYRWVNAVDAEGNTLFSRSINFLFPDSLVKYIDETGAVTFMPGSTNFGQVIDPKDINIDDVGDFRMTNNTSFTLDSIYFRYLYVRNIDAVSDGQGGFNTVVDTLFIDYFAPSGLVRSSLNGTPREIFAVPNWNMSQRRPTGGLVATQVILLTADDSTSAVADQSGNPESSWTTDIYAVKAPTGININTARNGSNIVGYNVRFKPGHDYYKGPNLIDSAAVIVFQKDPSTFPVDGTRANYFGYFNFSNGEDEPFPTQIAQTVYYTNSNFAVKRASYPGNPQGWAGFIPGNAYFAHQYLQTGFLLTSGNVSVKEIKNDNFAVSNIYPNPSTLNNNAAITFNLKVASTVNVNIYNITGQKVKSVLNQQFAAGEHTSEISLAGLKAGIYLVNTTVNGVSETSKLTITE